MRAYQLQSGAASPQFPGPQRAPFAGFSLACLDQGEARQKMAPGRAAPFHAEGGIVPFRQRRLGAFCWPSMALPRDSIEEVGSDSARATRTVHVKRAACGVDCF